jgi:hypothetical protein
MQCNNNMDHMRRMSPTLAIPTVVVADRAPIALRG